MQIIQSLTVLFWIVNPVPVGADEASQERTGMLLDVMDTQLIMQQGAFFGIQRVQENIGELQKMIEEVEVDASTGN